MSTCKLQGCNQKARRKFCCNKHKDRYHNLNNPRGIYAHLKADDMQEDGVHPVGYGHPFASGDEGHGQE